MNDTREGVASLSTEARNDLERRLLEFDQSWRPAAFAAAIAALPVDDPAYRRVAVLELVRIDLERHWQTGTRKLIDDYVHSVPELKTRESIPAELIAAECVIRQQFGDRVHFPDIVQRFPEQAATVERLVQQTRSSRSSLLDARASFDTATRVGDTQSMASKAKPSPEADSSREETSSTGTPSHPPVEPPAQTEPPESEQGVLRRTKPESSDAPPPVSGIFGRYRIDKLLGQGAMGAVYLAEDTTLQRRVALKIPRFDRRSSQELVDRFYREARAAATLQHHGICPVFDVDEIDGQHYISMAYIEGRPLTDFIRPGAPVSLRAAALVVRQIALALDHAHANGVIHRDLKPANIMINERKEPLVMDFGLARQMNASEESRATRDGDILGTPAYMSPEQVRGIQDEIGPPADIYSLGVILYELLTGQLPFRGSISAVIGLILTEEPPEISELRSDVNSGLISICKRMMAKGQSDRYRSMKDVADALGGWLRESGSTGRAEPVSGGVAGDGSNGSAAESDRAAIAELPSIIVHDSPIRRPRPKKPPGQSSLFFWRGLSPTTRWLTVAACAALLLAAIVFFVRTGDGTIRVEIDDPQIAVKIKGTDIVLQQADLGRDIRVKPGEHTLIVERGDFRFETDSLTLKRGRTVTVRVDLLPDRIEARADRQLLGQFQLPLADAPREESPAVATSGSPASGLTPTDILLSDDWTWTEPVSLGPRVNGSRYDTYPSLTGDGLAMYYMADRGEFGYNIDILVSRRQSLNAAFGRPERLGETVNSAASELSPCVSSDELELFFARYAEDNSTLPILHVCRRASTSEEFGPAKPLSPDVNSLFGGSHPAISPDHLTLVFASRRSTHPNDADLYRTSRPSRDAPFGPPVRIKELASPGDEHFPRFAPDGRSLIFSSTRTPTYGEEDIWIARRRDDDTFETPIHFDGGINTPDRDGSVALSPDGRTAIYHRGRGGWFDLWVSERVLRKNIAKYQPPDPGSRPPDYAVFATGTWIPVLRTQEDLVKCLTADKDVTGPMQEVNAIGPDGLKGATLTTEGVLELDRQVILLRRHMRKNLILRATVKKIDGPDLGLYLRWPRRHVVLAWFNGGPWFGMGALSEWDSETNRMSGWKDHVVTRHRDPVSEFEFAVARVDGYVWAYVNGRQILETVVEPSLPECMPALRARGGISRFRRIEVQFLDDDIAERVKLP